MLEFFSVDKIAFTVIGYPMSYIEFIGTMLYLLSVLLIAIKNMLTWPVGIVSVILYMVLFYQIQLYSDAIEQIYYLGASVYGWWWWRRSLEKGELSHDFRYSVRRTLLITIAITAVLSLAVGVLMTRIHELLPSIFTEKASYPYLDALTTIMSFVAMWLMAQKRIESWIFWIIVDVIGIWLYYVKDVHFISLLYVVLLVLATNGLISWAKAYKTKRCLEGEY